MRKINLKEKVYLFDLDGTLIDSMPTAVKIVLDFLDEQGISYPDDIVTRLTPLGFKGVAEYYTREMGVRMPPTEIFGYFQRRLAEEYLFRIPEKSHAKEAVSYLKGQGCRLNVLTASPHVLTDCCLKRLGLYGYFENVWSIEDFNCSKAEEKIYFEAAKRLGVKVEDCVMVDDNLTVLKTAKRAGMKIVGVFEANTLETAADAESISDGYVRDFSQFIP